MNMLTITRSAAIVALSAALASIATGQQSARAPDVDVARIQDLTRKLASADPLARAGAFEKLQKVPNVWVRPGMPAILMRLNEREQELVESTLRESKGNDGVSVKYGEDFGEYVGEVWGACWKYCGNRSALLTLLLKQMRSDVGVMREGTATQLRYFAAPRAGYSRAERMRLDSALIVAAHDPQSFMPRQAAIRSLADLVHTDTEMTPAVRTRIHDTFLAALYDPWIDVRIDAVRAVANFGDPRDTLILDRVVRSDTIMSLSRGRRNYPVREEARKAMMRLRQP